MNPGPATYMYFYGGDSLPTADSSREVCQLEMKSIHTLSTGTIKKQPSQEQCNMGLDVTKPVFRVSDKARFKPASSENLLVASLDMILLNE